MIHNLTIHDPTMHNSCINYPNKIKLYRKNYKTKIIQQEHYILLDQKALKTQSYSPRHVEFSGLFLKLINIYIVIESLFFTVMQLLA